VADPPLRDAVVHLAQVEGRTVNMNQHYGWVVLVETGSHSSQVEENRIFWKRKEARDFKRAQSQADRQSYPGSCARRRWIEKWEGPRR
jgi:hypothetical protein